MNAETAFVVMLLGIVTVVSVGVLAMGWLLYDGLRGIYRMLTYHEDDKAEVKR
ncbi:MAG: hypothetical protein V3U60_16130 [Gammaproteobacteria bacterium]